ncbi:MAG: NADH-quinone oxidoreductase subunit J [Ardenticatenales bacterium]
MIEKVAFGLVTAVALGGALGVVAARNVFVSALWLVLSFIGVAGLYALLGADFLAATQVLIYVGAISVLILFAIMLTSNVMSDERANNRQAFLAFIVASSVVAALGVLGYRTDWPVTWGDGATIVRVEAAAAGGAVGASAPVTATDGAAGQPAGNTDGVNRDENVVQLGTALLGEHLLSFEVISLVLLVALIGAIVIARD